MKKLLAVPVITGEAGVCPEYAVGTASVSYDALGGAAAAMAYEILVEGADVSAMPVRYAPYVLRWYNEELCSLLQVTVPEGCEPLR